MFELEVLQYFLIIGFAIGFLYFVDMLLEESVITPDQVESPNVHNNVPVSQQCSNDGSGSSSASNTVAKSTLWANYFHSTSHLERGSRKGWIKYIYQDGVTQVCLRQIRRHFNKRDN